MVLTCWQQAHGRAWGPHKAPTTCISALRPLFAGCRFMAELGGSPHAAAQLQALAASPNAQAALQALNVWAGAAGESQAAPATSQSVGEARPAKLPCLCTVTGALKSCSYSS